MPEISNIALWFNYMTCWRGLPEIGDPQKAHVVIVQAFGRNSYPDSEVHSIRELWEGCGRNDLTAVKKLRSLNFDPGKSNISLALECMEIMDKYGIPGIVQWEIAVAFPEEWYYRNADRIVCLWPPKGKGNYFSTWDVKILTYKIMNQRQWAIPIEVAHKRQITRAYLIVRKIMGKKVVVLPQKTTVFDPQSVQLWVRAWYLWLPREILTRLHHLYKGWVY